MISRLVGTRRKTQASTKREREREGGPKQAAVCFVVCERSINTLFPPPLYRVVNYFPEFCFVGSSADVTGLICVSDLPCHGMESSN